MKLLFFFFLFSSPCLIFAQQANGFAVVELFTSEGCSSCPAADKLLSQISNESIRDGNKVYCLAYHVDYWNRLGWMDPYSKFQFTRRQENYSRVLPSKELFTPQMIVNGSKEFTGSKEAIARAEIRNALAKTPDLGFNFVLDSLREDTAYVSWKLSKEDKNFVLQIAYTESGLSNKVSKGENAGKTLAHDHVVKVFSAVNNPSSSGQTIILLKNRHNNKSCELVGFIQHKQTYTISAADRIILD